MINTNCSKCHTEHSMVSEVSPLILEQIKVKVKKTGIKKPIEEITKGADFCKKKDKYIDRTMVIDREHDQYYEKIVDHSINEVLHECRELLSQHIGHGSAKIRKCKSKTKI